MTQRPERDVAIVTPHLAQRPDVRPSATCLERWYAGLEYSRRHGFSYKRRDSCSAEREPWERDPPVASDAAHLGQRDPS